MPEYAKDEEVSKPDLPEDPRLKDLEEKEKEWAKQYGLPYPADHDELCWVLEAKISKIEQEREDATRALNEAKELNRLRIELNERLKAPYTAKLDPERIWAVIIGIDAYPPIPIGNPRLWGCVRDALAFKEYLTDDLRVSDNHINLLLGPADLHDDHYSNDFRNSITRERYLEPNRAEIVSTLRGLSTREEIRKDDVIIIFYAGHGAAYRDIPLDDGESADIEALCPMDRGATDKAGTIIPDISDRETNSIVTEISRAKGHNITLILDCCHAGGITRGSGKVTETPRHTAPLREHAALAVMKNAADIILPGETVWRAGWKPDSASHVVLAACRRDQTAVEIRGKDGVSYGIFTDALIHALNPDQLESESTFLTLMGSLPKYPRRTPVLAGDYKDRRIWYTNPVVAASEADLRRPVSPIRNHDEDKRIQAESPSLRSRVEGPSKNLSVSSDFEAKPSIQHTIDGSHTWAVIIGIDAYMHGSLFGCVSDAIIMRDYLVDDLHVPRDRIQLLLGLSKESSFDSDRLGSYSIPSRANIISALCNLITDHQIQKGDNIIIYFAGNGSNYRCSGFYEFGDSKLSLAAVGTIEVLCPIDRGNVDDSGAIIPDISDRELNAIYRQICHLKGHHITVIIDCCHYTGHTRLSPGRAVRAIPSLPQASCISMLYATDKNLQRLSILRDKESIWVREWRPNMESHVILSACKAYQFAYEADEGRGYHGLFTAALISTLKSGMKKGSTYIDLLFALPQWPNQTPVLAGVHKDALVWYQD